MSSTDAAYDLTPHLGNTALDTVLLGVAIAVIIVFAVLIAAYAYATAEPGVPGKVRRHRTRTEYWPVDRGGPQPLDDAPSTYRPRHSRLDVHRVLVPGGYTPAALEQLTQHTQTWQVPDDLRGAAAA